MCARVEEEASVNAAFAAAASSMLSSSAVIRAVLTAESSAGQGQVLPAGGSNANGGMTPAP